MHEFRDKSGIYRTKVEHAQVWRDWRGSMIDDIRAILDGYLDTRMTYRTPDSNLPVVRSIVRTAD